MNALRDQARQEFPLSAGETADFRAGLREHVLRILSKEREAVIELQAAIADG